MPDIPNWLAWASLVVSMAFNVWQWRQSLVRETKMRHLIPAWSGWADAIRSQASADYHLVREKNEHTRSVALSMMVECIQASARNLADDIDRVADEYRSPEELATKKRERERIEEIGKEEKEQRRRSGAAG